MRFFLAATAALWLGCAESADPPKGGGSGVGSGGGSQQNVDGFLDFPDFGTVPLDLSGGWGGGGGGNPDLATGGGGNDLAVQAKTGCHGEIGCVNACAAGDSACETGCRNNTTASGDQMFQSLIDCINVDCPGDFSTDPCFDPNSTKCSNCVQSAQSGFCAPELSSCNADTP